MEGVEASSTDNSQSASQSCSSFVEEARARVLGPGSDLFSIQACTASFLAA